MGRKQDAPQRTDAPEALSVKEKREQYIAEMKEREARRRAEKKKRLRRRVIVATAVVLVLAILLSVLGLHWIRTKNGSYLRESVCMYTDDVIVDGAMMLYFVNSAYLSDLDLYGDEFEDYNLNPDKKLSEQPFQGGTWLDVYMTSAKDRVEDLLILAQGAKENGVELDAYEKARIDQTMKKGMDPRLDSRLTEADMRRCLELLTLASKYQTVLIRQFSYTEEQYETYYNEHTADFAVFDCMRCEIYFDEMGSADTAKEWADRLAACESREAFEQTAQALYRQKKGEAEDADAAQYAADCFRRGESYTHDDAGDWAFDAARRVGDTFVYTDTTNERYIVFRMEKLPYRDENKTVNVRHILFTADTYGSLSAARAAAAQILSEWGEDPCEENFANLAHLYSEDGGSRSNGGLYEMVEQGEMASGFDDWCFDGKRKAGDTGIVESEHGIHLMYYVGDSLPVWKARVDQTRRSSDYNVLFSKLTEQYTVTYVTKSLEKVEI